MRSSMSALNDIRLQIRMGIIGKDDISPDELLSDEMVRGLPELTQIVPTIKRILKIEP